MSESYSGDGRLSRRRFLKVGSLAAGGLFLAACKVPLTSPTPETSSGATAILKKHELQSGDLTIHFGTEQQLLVNGLPNQSPDGHVSMIKLKNNVRAWITAGTESHLVEGPSWDSLAEKAIVLRPDRIQGQEGYQGYRGFGSVVPGNDAALMGFYHEEHWQNQNQWFPFNAHIGLAISKDGGWNWERKGKLITGMDTGQFSENRVFGAGEPSACMVGDMMHLYYVDWNRRSADAIHVARAPLTQVQMPNAWQKWDGTSFKNPGLSGESVPIMLPTNEEHTYAALPSVSYNKYLGKFLMVFETNLGFSLSTSSDGIKWSQSELVLEFPQPRLTQKKGDVWYSYPTLVSDTISDTVTDKTGWLVASRGVLGTQDHTPVRIPYNLG